MTRQNFLSTAIAVIGFGRLAVVDAAETAPALTKKDLKSAITNAKTPQDHQRIADYFKKEADRMLADAKDHEELAVAYAKSPNPHETKHPMAGLTAEHCKFFAEAARKAAQQSQELAKLHEDMAKQAR